MGHTIAEWFDAISGPSWHWYAKRLSGNDTLLNQSHQAGPYITKPVVLSLFGSLASSGDPNPRAFFNVSVDSHCVESNATAIWYNSKLRGKTRDECRITGWGGRDSPVLDPESTGSLCIFAFRRPEGATDADTCRLWLCLDAKDEEIAADWIGRSLEPGQWYFREHREGRPCAAAGLTKAYASTPCRLSGAELPVAWRTAFPSAAEIVRMAVERARDKGAPDKRLLSRRACEYEIFRSVEDCQVLPLVKPGFDTVEAFVEAANPVLQRRKARSGLSLELHAKQIFAEEDLEHSYNQVSEGKKRPDFLFPSSDAYHDPAYPTHQLRMLAVKTTCRDRWRQILNEADRLETKYLLTIQEGLSHNQFQEMCDEQVQLVVPGPLHTSYPLSIRPSLLTLERFISETGDLSVPTQRRLF